MKTRRNTLTVVMMIAAIVLMASSADATILTFEGKGTNVNIPDTFGDDVAAAETGISVANGATPNIDLTWSDAPVWQFYNDGEWTGAAQLDGYGVGNNHDILFTPDSGYSVLVDSFVFDDYASYASGNKFNWWLFQDSAAGATIASGTETTTNGQDLLVSTGMATGYGGPVLLRVTEHPDNVSGSGVDQALDSISFTQAGGTPQPPVPAPLDTNLVLNPAFEDVDPTVTGSYSSVKALDWDAGDTAWTFRYDQNYDNGTPPPGAGLRYFNGYSHAAQLIDVRAGDAATAIAAGTADYDLSAYFSSYGSQRDYGTIDLTFLDGMGGTLGTDTITDGDSTQWSLEAATGTVPVGTATVRIDIYGTARSGDPDGYIDNVDFRITSSAPAGDIPELATMALLALAACGLGGYVRRRRKA